MKPVQSLIQAKPAKAVQPVKQVKPVPKVAQVKAVKAVKPPAKPQAVAQPSPKARTPVAKTSRVVPSVKSARGTVRTDTHNQANQVPSGAKRRRRGL